MERVTAEFSLKDIPLPTLDEFKKSYLVQANNFIKNLRWRVLFSDKKHKDSNNVDTSTKLFPFKSRKCPPSTKELDGFEKDLLNVTAEIKPRKHPLVNNRHIQGLHAFLRTARAHGDLLVSSDKTANIYKVTPSLYFKLIRDEIHRSYKIVNSTMLNRLNSEHFHALRALRLLDKTEPYRPREPRITLKDHKPDFGDKYQVRLICPSKSDVGIVSKKLLDNIIPTLADRMRGVCLWNNTLDALNWFNDLRDKRRSKFIQFDIENYYNSIDQDLLDNALAYATTYTAMTFDEAAVVKLARKTLISFNGQLWARKDTQDGFDVTMGSSDSAQVTDLIGLFLLNTIADEIPIARGGLYRDDGLLVLNNVPNRMMEKTRKQLIAIFNRYRLKISIDCNVKNVNFLDANLNLNTETHTPYHKPNECLRYVDIHSNHPNSVKKAIVKSVSSRISMLSSNIEIFSQHAPYYEIALRRAGYRAPLVFTPGTNHGRQTGGGVARLAQSRSSASTNPRPNNTHPHRNDSGRTSRTNSNKGSNVIWFTPPFGMHLQTNIAKKFFDLLDKHFPRGSKLCKIINRHTVKMSYSTTANMGENIMKINTFKLRRHLKSTQPPNLSINSVVRKCNCLDKTQCPMQNKCLTESIIYRAEVISNGITKHYIGSTINSFKKRFYQHTHSLKENTSASKTSLANYINLLRESKLDYIITWRILKKVKAYEPGDKHCMLCATECLEILKHRTSAINYFSETLIRCKHIANKAFSNFPFQNF